MGNIKLLFTGDFIPPESENSLFSDELKNILSVVDFSIINLETPITNSSNWIRKTGNSFKRSPSVINQFKGQFNAVALSNNHIRDYGNKGVMDTLNVCKQNNILTVGAGFNNKEAAIPLRINIKNKNISILNYSEHEFNIATENRAGANGYNTINSFYDIVKEKRENDYVIVIYHGGLENQYYPTPEMVENFKYMIDVGADAIISHHSHRYSGSITYNGKLILFGLGNFLSPTSNINKKEWSIGLIAVLKLTGNNIVHELLPIKMSSDFRSVDLINNKNEKQLVHNHIKKISSKIEDQDMFNDYWSKNDNMEKSRIINLLKSDSHLEYRIRKYCPYLFKSSLSKYKALLLLNLIRCESHRNRLIRILENEYINT